MFDLARVIDASGRSPTNRLVFESRDFFTDPLPSCECSLVMHVLHDWNDQDASKIRAEANEALTLDPTNADPHFLLASVAAAYEYDWTAALDLFASARAETSAVPEVHWAYASLYLQP